MHCALQLERDRWRSHHTGPVPNKGMQPTASRVRFCVALAVGLILGLLIACFYLHQRIREHETHAHGVRHPWTKKWGGYGISNRASGNERPVSSSCMVRRVRARRPSAIWLPNLGSQTEPSVGRRRR